MASSSSGKLFGLLIGGFLLVLVLMIISDFIVSAANLTGIAATVVQFLPAILAVVGIALMLKEAGFTN